MDQSAYQAEKNRQQQLARYAFEHRWADLSVQATIIAKLWDHLTERFPIAWEQEFERYTKDKKLIKVLLWRLPGKKVVGIHKCVPRRVRLV